MDTEFTGRTRILTDGYTYAVDCECIEHRWVFEDRTHWLPLEDGDGVHDQPPKPVRLRVYREFSSDVDFHTRFDTISEARGAAEAFHERLARKRAVDFVKAVDVTPRLEYYEK